MRIYGYTQINGVFAKPTGVAKHIDQMFNRLGADPDIQFSMLLAADQRPEVSPLARLPAVFMPQPRRRLEWMWMLGGFPSVDPYVPDADWIYCPIERPIPSRRHRIACTVHSLYWFDRTLPGSENWRFTRMKFRLMLRPMIRHCAVIFTVSEFLKRQIVEWFGARREQIVVVGNGAEPEFFEASQAPVGVAGRPYVVVVSGLNYLDGAEYVLTTARALRQLDPDIRILVAGHQNESEYVEQAREIPNIELLGYQHSRQLAKLMHDSVALLFLNRYESFGMGVVEAMAAGTPVIGTNFTAVPEIVGEAGIIADVTKPEDIARQIVELARTPSLRTHYIELGARRAADFTWQACVGRLIAALKHPIA